MSDAASKAMKLPFTSPLKISRLVDSTLDQVGDMR